MSATALHEAAKRIAKRLHVRVKDLQRGMYFLPLLLLMLPLMPLPLPLLLLLLLLMLRCCSCPY
jgi:hypothetical protein